MSDFPNSWTWIVAGSQSLGVVLSLPAIPGVSHIIDEVSCTGYSTVANATDFSVSLEAPIGTVLFNPLLVALFWGGASGYTSSADDFVGPIMLPVGVSAAFRVVSAPTPASTNKIKLTFRGRAK